MALLLSLNFSKLHLSLFTMGVRKLPAETGCMPPHSHPGAAGVSSQNHSSPSFTLNKPINQPRRPACPQYRLSNFSFLLSATSGWLIPSLSPPPSTWEKGFSFANPRTSICSREGKEWNRSEEACGCPLENYFASSHS